MAIKTFTTGEVLTSADTNTYLANSGLVYITSGTTTTGSVSFDNCFTSAYNKYRVEVEITGSQFGQNLWGMRFRKSGTDTSTNNYFWVFTDLYISAGVAGTSIAGAATTSIIYLGYKSPTSTHVTRGSIDIFNPLSTTQHKAVNFQTCNTTATLDATDGGGTLQDITAHDGMSIISSTGTMTCKATVYGYRQA
jgi:hypothetical protein